MRRDTYLHWLRRVLIMAGAVAMTGSAFAQDVPLEAQAFTEFVAERAKARAGSTAIAVKSPLTLSVGRLEATLDRVFNYCQANAAGCLAQIDEYIAVGLEMAATEPETVTREMLRAVVRLEGYGDTSGDAGFAPIEPRLLVKGLIAIPVVDLGRTSRTLGQDDSSAMGLTSDEVHQLALDNVRATLQPLTAVAKPAAAGQIGTLTDDYYHPSRLLLHDTWAPLAQAQGGKLIVVAPTKDALLYFSDDTPEARAALRLVAQRFAQQSPSPLAPDILLRWTPDGWQRAD
jgi:hypothetical protein